MSIVARQSNARMKNHAPPQSRRARKDRNERFDVKRKEIDEQTASSPPPSQGLRWAGQPSAPKEEREFAGADAEPRILARGVLTSLTSHVVQRFSGLACMQEWVFRE